MPNITLTDIPIGVYTLHLPTSRDQKYQPQPVYLVIKHGENNATISFNKKQASTLLTQNINLLALADIMSASIMVNYTQSQVLIGSFEQTPHRDFPNKIYSKITIRNAKGEVTLIKEIKVTNEHLSHDEIIFSLGDQIEIYHAEPHRLKVNSFY